jgi:tetratricopeptide (TPR) repeat protein
MAGQPPASLARAERLAREARERGLREGNAGRPAVGARYVRAGLRRLGWAEDGDDARQVAQAHHTLAARLLIILAGWEAKQGRTEYGLRLLDRAEALAAADERGILLIQRGLLCLRRGRASEALGMFDDAIAALTANPAETENLASALLNRSLIHLSRGDVRRARADLDWCRRVAADGRHDLIVPKALHNLGYCDLLAGDIPGALRLFTAAASAYQHGAAGNLPVLAVDKARALMAAGLAGEAAAELDEAMASFRRQRLDHDLAEAELTRSEAALAAGEPDVARRWAAAAERHFRRLGNEALAELAVLTGLRVRWSSPRRRQPARIAAQAAGVATRLRGCGLDHDADLAELLAARALVAAGRLAEARRRLAAGTRRRTAEPLAIGLLRRLARAELAERERRPGAALAELRAGLAMVQARRGRLGSLDLQAGVGALGTELAAAGLRLALDRGSAAQVFAWLERSRAQAFLVRPVRPPADPQAAAALAELRQLGYLIRTAELAGRRDPSVIARRAELQREIREHGWLADGPDDGPAGGPAGGTAGGPAAGRAQASLGEVGAALAAGGQVLAGLAAWRGRALAAVVGRGPARLVRLGDFEAAAEAARRLNADLDTLAGRRPPARLEAVIRESIRHQTRTITAEIVEPLLPWLGDGGIVMVPTGTLAGIPWSILPGLRGRAVSVCPSAAAWLAAWRRGQEARAGAPLLVAGPDLAYADTEVTEIAGCYPGCRPLLGETATVGATLDALDGAPLAHLAAHGHHDGGNFLFSRLDLADGPLMAHDIQQLDAAPQHVVLSCCDVGRAVVRPGEEILGFTTALLYVGTATVISSVTRVADSAAMGVMTAYHRSLAAGSRPAEALAAAAATEEFSPFVCFGAG